MKKNIIITKNELKKIIKEGVEKLHRKTIIENRIKQINEELREIVPTYVNDNIENYKKRHPKEFDNYIREESEFVNSKVLDIIDAYLEAALWTEEDEVGSASVNDISIESREGASQDVLEFISKAGSLLDGIEPSQIGHDLWLTRNGHGAGFWDRGLGDVGDSLSEIAREMGSKYLYRGDDGKIYID